MLGKEDCSVSTPTVVASAAPLCNEKRLMATATASSKKLEATIIRGAAENTVRDEGKELADNGKEPKEE